MEYGICPLSIVPLRLEPTDTSEMVSQVLYGEFFKILETRKKWSRIRLAHDNYEGWIDNKQLIRIPKEDHEMLDTAQTVLSGDLLGLVTNQHGDSMPIPIGSSLGGLKTLAHKYQGAKFTKVLPKEKLIELAFAFLNAPYLWGGRTPFGIDCSGFTQMVYRLCGKKIPRDAYQQATQGEVLSFIEESEPGDLAFFDDQEGTIIHVGLIMKDHHIIHAHGKVRIDRLDQSGIYNVNTRRHSHRLRVIKKII